MDIHYAISEDIGWRERMEDEHAIYHLPERDFFSAEIYDGHGGRQAAQYASEMLTPTFIHLLTGEYEKPLKDRRQDFELLREAYQTVDTYIIARESDVGTTAASFYILDDRFIAANVGDSKIIIGTTQGVVSLSKDHKPNLPEEKKRIESLGGEVIVYGVPRVQGVLAISRALGDAFLKPYVSAEPRIVEGHLGRENDFVIIACDGVWDVLSPENVIQIARKAQNIQAAADLIKTEALEHGSTDNISVIVLDLREHVKAMRREKLDISLVIDRT